MNRNQEYYNLIEELDSNTPDIQSSIEKARTRKKRISYIYRPLTSVAACFVLFVALVNFCTPVAYACSNVPFLKELASAVTFSRSLSDAVENEYVQQMDLSQTENDITVNIEYLIVDQKQVNVFYRLISDKYTNLEPVLDVLSGDGNNSLNCSYYFNPSGPSNGELRSFTIDFADDDVPGNLCVQLSILNASDDEDSQAENENQDENFWDLPEEDEDYIAKFEFLLEFDPQFTASGKVIPVNSTIEIDGQKIIITQIEVYPTNLRVDVENDPDNTVWLKDLDFYIETDWGMKFEPVSNGIISTGSDSSPSMTSYRADSTYFYEAKHINLVITGVQWLEKDMEKTYVDLTTGKTGKLPNGTEFVSAEKKGTDWIVTFRSDYSDDNAMYQVFDNCYYDAEGNQYEINAVSYSNGNPDENGNCEYFIEQIPLQNYPYDEVWLSPSFSHYWNAENEIIVPIQ